MSLDNQQRAGLTTRTLGQPRILEHVDTCSGILGSTYDVCLGDIVHCSPHCSSSEVRMVVGIPGGCSSLGRIKQQILRQCCFNYGSRSATLAQYAANFGFIFLVAGHLGIME